MNTKEYDEELMTKLGDLEGQLRIHSFRERADKVVQRLVDTEEPPIVMVVGEGNFGKSTLINALLGSEVAPVSRLPKTWKIDLYEPIGQQEEALLYWYSKGNSADHENLANAKEICDNEEKLAVDKTKNGEEWKSDLYQVKWKVNTQWPKKKMLLVDTPGFAQFRADTSVSNINLYGSKGIELVASDAFEYFYYRADIVLWCLKATKLEDSDTLEALQNVKIQGKNIIGILTYMDRIESDKWEEVKAKACDLYGSFIQDFIFSAAGSKNGLKEQTTERIRTYLDERYLNNGDKYKKESLDLFYKTEVDYFIHTTEAVMNMYMNNCRLHDQLVKKAKSNEKALEDLKIKIQNNWKEYENKAIGKLDSIWYDAGENVERFSQLVQQNAINKWEIESETNKILETFNDEFNAEQLSIKKEIVWKGLKIGNSAATQFNVLSSSIEGSTRSYKTSGDWRASYTGEEGVNAGIIGGIGAAAIGMMALGPIGLIAGGVGWLIGLMFKKGQSIGKAQDAIKKYFSTNSQQLFDTLISNYQPKINFLVKEIDNSFKDHHGKDIPKVVDQARNTDRSLNILNAWPENYTRFSFITEKGKEWYSIYYFRLLKYDSGSAKLWDAEIKKYYEEKCDNLLKNLSNAADLWISSIKSKIDRQPLYGLKVSYAEDKELQPLIKLNVFEKLNQHDYFRHLAWHNGNKILEAQKYYQDKTSGIIARLEVEQTTLRKLYDNQILQCYMAEIKGHLASQLFNHSQATLSKIQLHAILYNYIEDFENYIFERVKLSSNVFPVTGKSLMNRINDKQLFNQIDKISSDFKLSGNHLNNKYYPYNIEDLTSFVSIFYIDYYKSLVKSLKQRLPDHEFAQTNIFQRKALREEIRAYVLQVFDFYENEFIKEAKNYLLQYVPCIN